MNTQLLDQAMKLSIDERIELVEALWDSIAAPDAAPGAIPALTRMQVDELAHRSRDLDAHPDDTVSWSEAKASALARIRR